MVLSNFSVADGNGIVRALPDELSDINSKRVNKFSFRATKEQ
jgi:hypothetical protein